METVDPAELVRAILGTSIRNIVGVPDSTLYPFLKQLEEKPEFDCLIATNECEAISIAAGQFMASGLPSLVYLQNSGFGKMIHPILTLLHQEICALPAVLLIGWRGAPGVKDEPQHKLMGAKLLDLLKAIDVPYKILSKKSIQEDFNWAVSQAKTNRQVTALIAHPELMTKSAGKDLTAPESGLNRSRIIQLVAEHFSLSPILSTTGKISRELCDLRERSGEKEKKSFDFYTVGGMGCVSSLGLGVARGIQKNNPKAISSPVVILDGDGACLMQMGSFTTIGTAEVPLVHFVLDNACHESTGGQPTLSNKINLSEVAKACGYKKIHSIVSEDELLAAMRLVSKTISTDLSPQFIHVKYNPGDSVPLGRPKDSPRESTDHFIKKLKCGDK